VSSALQETAAPAASLLQVRVDCPALRAPEWAATDLHPCGKRAPEPWGGATGDALRPVTMAPTAPISPSRSR